MFRGKFDGVRPLMTVLVAEDFYANDKSVIGDAGCGLAEFVQGDELAEGIARDDFGEVAGSVLGDSIVGILFTRVEGALCLAACVASSVDTTALIPVDTERQGFTHEHLLSVSCRHGKTKGATIKTWQTKTPR
jgi:hypothetical protein